MPDGKDPERQRLGRLGGLTGSRNTPDWSARMAHVRANSPADDRYWARKLRYPEDPQRQTAAQRKKIRTEKKLHFAGLRESSVRATKLKKAERLRQRAAAREAEAGE